MPKVFIAGCGFVGEFAAGLFLDNGWDVVAIVGSDESARRLEGRFPCAAADLADAASVSQVAEQFGEVDAVVHCASSGRGGLDAYERIYVRGAKNLVHSHPGVPLVFTGSTSVFAQTDGSWVDESGKTMPDRDTGRALLKAEEIVLEAGGLVARLAGIYGPGRSVLLRKFLDGSAIVEDGGSRWINQVHRDDAAGAIFHLIAHQAASGVYNVCDDTPVTQLDVYRWISAATGKPMPPDRPRDLNRKRGWTSKRISNAKLKGTGWSPRFPSYRDALPLLLREKS